MEWGRYLYIYFKNTQPACTCPAKRYLYGGNGWISLNKWKVSSNWNRRTTCAKAVWHFSTSLWLPTPLGSDRYPPQALFDISQAFHFTRACLPGAANIALGEGAVLAAGSRLWSDDPVLFKVKQGGNRCWGAELGGLDPSSPAGAALNFRDWKTCPPHSVCLLGTGSDVFCGRWRMTTSDPAPIKIPITHYKATEFSPFFPPRSGKGPRGLA